MTDYAEEQANEIEALESIYPEEFTLIEASPNHIFQVPISAQSEEDEDETLSCTLQFTYTAEYPDTAPLIQIVYPENLEDDDVQGLLDLLQQEAESNLGMVMIFTLVSAAQEHLTQLMEHLTERRQKAAEEALRKQEEAERKKFEGTRVTIETFLAWKNKFDAEMAELKRQRGQQKDSQNAKLTGKELFMKDNTLDDSDVKFFEEEGDAVTVDESLFEDMEDLDLDDEELET